MARALQLRASMETGAEGRGGICVFASSLLLSITIERLEEDDEIHLHPAGQAFWIARMLRNLGERPVVVAALGGEAGRVLCQATRDWDVELSAVEIQDDSPSYVHERRDGERKEIARSREPVLGRHEADTLYGRVLEHATATGSCVVTGRMPGSRLSLDFYQRLGADLRSIGVTAIGDLHGEELDAFLDGGGLHTLKLSDEDLAEDASLPPNASLEQRIEAVEAFRRRGVERVVLSSSDSAPLASFGGTLFRADFPPIEVVDHRGAGDAMTAGLVAAALRGLDPTRTLQLACAAGAANVARRGLGNVEASLVESLSERVTVTALADGGES